MTFPSPGNNSHRTTLTVASNKILVDLLLPTAAKLSPDHSIEVRVEWKEVDRGGTPCLAFAIHLTKDEVTRWLQSDPYEFESEHEFIHSFQKMLSGLRDEFEDAVLDLLKITS